MATNFLEYSGGTNGFLAVPATFMSTEMGTGTGLANNTGATQSVAGVMSQTTWNSGIWGIAYFTPGATITPTAGGYIACWFLFSPDGGTTFEVPGTNLDLPRQPDFTIPFAAAATGTNIVRSTGPFLLPWWTTKLYVMNHAGVALGASGNLIRIGSMAIQY